MVEWWQAESILKDERGKIEMKKKKEQFYNSKIKNILQS